MVRFFILWLIGICLGLVPLLARAELPKSFEKVEGYQAELVETAKEAARECQRQKFEKSLVNLEKFQARLEQYLNHSMLQPSTIDGTSSGGDELESCITELDETRQELELSWQKCLAGVALGSVKRPRPLPRPGGQVLPPQPPSPSGHLGASPANPLLWDPIPWNLTTVDWQAFWQNPDWWRREPVDSAETNWDDYFNWRYPNISPSAAPLSRDEQLQRYTDYINQRLAHMNDRYNYERAPLTLRRVFQGLNLDETVEAYAEEWGHNTLFTDWSSVRGQFYEGLLYRLRSFQSPMSNSHWLSIREDMRRWRFIERRLEAAFRMMEELAGRKARVQIKRRQIAEEMTQLNTHFQDLFRQTGESRYLEELHRALEPLQAADAKLVQRGEVIGLRWRKLSREVRQLAGEPLFEDI